MDVPIPNSCFGTRRSRPISGRTRPTTAQLARALSIRASHHPLGAIRSFVRGAATAAITHGRRTDDGVEVVT